MWASGAYISIRFKGTFCELNINDELIYGIVHNYLEVKVDDQPAYRIQLKNKENKIELAKNLPAGEHTIVICKNTEFENGYVEIIGFSCEKLLSPPAEQKRKIEFIGDSITCGFGSDESEIKCGDKNAQWYDQHNAYLAYGPLTARTLNAQYHISAVSGIGLIHSCCDKKILMPQVFDKINMSKNEMTWDFNRYQPDVVTVCLGQNDGVQDSAQFCNAYVQFAQTLRSYYPKAKLIFLSSPMANKPLKKALVKYIQAVEREMIKKGDRNVGTYVFTKQSMKGCGSHPSLAEQKEIGNELTSYLKKAMKW
ncbi:Lysophospholipase L1 [Pedobacter insulae]|uniref:Lysophospholipase L1 n=2 Tax=Pedobacter insulae TaxID=414048 RepID=A0A1I2XF97_9SPHI|nr:Lysophospholipase L1 [Pedobacter insulae]